MENPPILKRRRWWLVPLILLVLMGGCHLAFGPPIYYSDPIQARVIDEETGKPIEGAAVLAQWWVRGLNMTVIYVDEAATDTHGIFRLKGMPPRLRPLGRYADWQDPELIVYKHGYFIERLSNHDAYPFGYAQGRFNRSMRRWSYWNGKTIPMERVENIRDAAKVLQGMDSYASHAKFETESDLPLIGKALIDGYTNIPRHIRQEFYIDRLADGWRNTTR